MVLIGRDQIDLKGRGGALRAKLFLFRRNNIDLRFAGALRVTLVLFGRNEIDLGSWWH